MARNRGAHLVELAHVFRGTPVASEWARKAAATRQARTAQLALPMSEPVIEAPAAEQLGAADAPHAG